jgi:hypothetical protein
MPRSCRLSLPKALQHPRKPPAMTVYFVCPDAFVLTGDFGFVPPPKPHAFRILSRTKTNIKRTIPKTEILMQS